MTWKKRIMSIALCLCALLCAASVRADAANTAAHTHLVCGGTSGTTCTHAGDKHTSSQTWTAWDGTDKDSNKDGLQLTAGHYYLSDNVTLSSTIEISGEVYLCLNGCTLSCSEYVSGDSNSVGGMVLLDNSAVLNICDCKGNGSIVHNYNYDSNWRKSTVRVRRGSTLNLYGGSVIMEQGKAVAAIDLDYDTGANFYMYGGKVENKSNHYDPYSTYAVYVQGNSSQDGDSNVKIYGGEIICKNGYGIRAFYQAHPSILVAGGKIESGNTAIGVSYAALTLQGKPTISTTDQDYAAIGLSQSSPLIKVTNDFAPETPVSVGKIPLTTDTEFAEPVADNETLEAEARGFVSHEAGYFIENNASGRLQFTACAITGQPSEENGYTVTANGAPSYQWYTAAKGKIPVTESNTTKRYSYLSYVDWMSVWRANSIPDANTGLFTIQMEEGDTLKLDFSYVSVEKVTLTAGTQRVIEGEKAGNNSYTITVDEAGEYTLKVDATANGHREPGGLSVWQFTATVDGYVAGQSMPGQTDRKLNTEGLGGNYLCKVTWESKTELTSLSVHVHDWQPATCTAPKTCSTCHTTEGEAKGHAYDTKNWVYDKDNHWHKCKNANCTEIADQAEHIPGAAATEETPQTCTMCGYVMQAALGHTDNWVLVPVKSATCTEQGVQEHYECKGCGHKSVTDGVYTVVSDTDLLTPIDPNNHTWSAWVVTTPATKDAPGVETRTCTHDPAHTETRSIPKLGKSNAAVYSVSEDTEIKLVVSKVDGLDDLLSKILEKDENKELIKKGQNVDVSLTVKNTASTSVSEKIKEKLAGSSLVGLRLELTVERTVTANGVVESKQTIPDAGVLLKTTITLPAELQGKSGYVVYRLHGENVDVLTETANNYGECIFVSADKTQLTICARLYSEYVVAYQTGGSSGGGYHPVNPTPVKATSANTGDAGVLLYGVTAALSLTGTAWLGAKGKKH